MELTLDRPGDFRYVRRVGTHAVTVDNRELTASFLLTPERIVEDWPVSSVGVLDAAHAPAILALQPELVLLGSGVRQAFPAAAFLAVFLGKGIGVEVMDNAAAARTYDLLASEGRRVVAAFILPAGDAAGV